MTQTPESLPLLGRRGISAPPVRIVHLGLGAFHRSHQAWFTAKAPDAGDWGIAAFTGRRPDAAVALSAQDGLYTLVTRGAEGDEVEVITSVVEAVDGANTRRLNDLVAASSTAIVTLTVTEKVYDDDSADSPLGRLVRALGVRRGSGSGPLAIVSCDNLADNGTVTRNAVKRLADAVDPALSLWIDENISFVSTSVDRITPRVTEQDVAFVAARCGYRDNSPVVAEPFTSWILSGAFPAGRPAWEEAGAQFVEDIEPFENRKLWLLNGAHSTLAYAGRLRGHKTVAEALSDTECRGLMEAFWDEATRHLTLPELDIPGYRLALLNRFANPRIAHYLAQIAMDGSTKLRMRAVPVLRAERLAGRDGYGAARVLAAWMDFVSEATELHDPLAEQILPTRNLDQTEQTMALLHLIDAALASDAIVVDAVDSLRNTFN
ncbi:mannitol-1-phosphate 5-dehydrogenase (plasmid) [Arthrobacter sp. StoSoilB3]|nr:mannitol-1-phosphate 5-dehydrogenase [Arthrobacter sp. StoSoilB3]